ncbi:MAG: MATE family efflux transporter, partial [Chitinophagales bacterium]
MNVQKRSYFKLFIQALKGENVDATAGSINRVIFFLAIPMILEMFMESLFAIVDIYFVSKVSVEAMAMVGLTESTLTIIYSLGFGLAMGATALVARRVGEKDIAAAKVAAVQAIYLGIGISIVIATFGIFFSRSILGFMGASDALIDYGIDFTRLMYTGNIT